MTTAQMHHASHQVYFVAPEGNDAGHGSLDDPWRTIQRAADRLCAGQTVLIRGGVYRERVMPRHSGSAEQPIRYAAFPGEQVIIDGAGIELPAHTPVTPRTPLPDHDWPGAHIGHPRQLGGLFHLEGVAHIEVRGLQVINVGPHRDNAGILVKDCNDIVIVGNVTRNTLSSGIGVWRSHRVMVVDNEVELACNDGGQECITLAGVDDFEVAYNHVHHSGPGSQGGEGIDIKHGSSRGRVHHNHVEYINRPGIYVDAWNTLTRVIEIDQNLVHHNAGDGITVASEAGGLLEDVHIHDNIVFSNGYSGFVVGWYGDAEHQPIRGVVVASNCFFDNGRRGLGGGVWVENPDSREIVIRHNQLWRNREFEFAVRNDVPSAAVIFQENDIANHR